MRSNQHINLKTRDWRQGLSQSSSNIGINRENVNKYKVIKVGFLFSHIFSVSFPVQPSEDEWGVSTNLSRSRCPDRAKNARYQLGIAPRGREKRRGRRALTGGFPTPIWG